MQDTCGNCRTSGVWKIFSAAIIVSAFINGCGEPNQYVEPPPPKVTVAQPLIAPATDFLEFTGSTSAYEKVEIRARVSGILQSMHFTPGTIVEKDRLLFIIDPREYRARLNSALAELASAEARLRRAEIEFTRAEKLYRQRAGAETEVVKWEGERDSARAAVANANAKIERARLDLSYTQVKSPLSGRVSRNFVDPGNLVGESEPTLLTTVTRFHPIYVYFNINERLLLKVMANYRRQLKAHEIDPSIDAANKAQIPLSMALVTENGYPHDGIVDFAESGVDPGTGTLQLRGLFPNDKKPPDILPGMFARVRMPVGQKDDAMLVAERAIGSDQGGRFLLTVSGDNTVEKRSISMGQLVDGLRVIEEGLRPDELVIVNGLQRARPGGKVIPERIDMASLKTSALQAEKEKQPDRPASAETKGAE